MDLDKKYENLLEILRAHQPLAVAFSGGVDSTFLLYAAKMAMGDKVTAFTETTEFFPERERLESSDFCRENGIRQVFVEYEILQMEQIRQNPKNRCYLCKRELFGQLKAAAKERGIEAVAEGSNLDDLGDYRPGLRAIEELGVLSPLRMADLTKAEIRQLSKRFGLPTWSKPAFACLATRFVYGQTITKEKLAMVDKAEDLLLSLGFTQFRVRIHETMARIEVLPEQFSLLIREDVRPKVVKTLQETGFSYVSMDLNGYRTGSMNDGI